MGVAKNKFAGEPMRFYFPQDRYYDRVNHLWFQMAPAGSRVNIGMDALGLEALGDLVYLTLSEVGMPVKRGKPLGTLEAAKMTGELIAPVSGTLVARNESVLRDPHLVNRDCYGEGWLVAIQPSDWATESMELVHGPDVTAWVEAEVERYRSQGWINVS